MKVQAKRRQSLKPTAWRRDLQAEEKNEMDVPVTLHWQERRLGRTLLRTYHDTVDLYDAFPNDKQPRMGPKEDTELQRQIEANEGIFEPLLLEPHPENKDKFRIIDGDRRWTNSKILVEVHKKDQYSSFPQKSLTERSRMKSDFASGFTSIAKDGNGTPKKRKWWPIAWLTWLGELALRI